MVMGTATTGLDHTAADYHLRSGQCVQGDYGGGHEGVAAAEERGLDV